VRRDKVLGWEGVAQGWKLSLRIPLDVGEARFFRIIFEDFYVFD